MTVKTSPSRKINWPQFQRVRIWTSAVGKSKWDLDLSWLDKSVVKTSGNVGVGGSFRISLEIDASNWRVS